ncbi:hypothetical protein Syun_010591 [Stephania yunnanensis]|uniref:Uncharacterized protein n=1 Tax=Stephania yunnanensis TaxID=152371 RepID=A0AAP0KJ35_9MAGN
MHMHKKKQTNNTTTTIAVQIKNNQQQQQQQQSLAARRLILLRHAHSSSQQQHPSLKDHDRPLTKAGRTDAAKVSKILQQMGWIPQLILSSDSARTRETLKIMQDHVHALLDAIVYFIPSFYSIAAMDGQTADHLQRVICEHARDPDIHTVILGGNLGWHECALMISSYLIHLRTCNYFLLDSLGQSFLEFCNSSSCAFDSTGLRRNKLCSSSAPPSVSTAKSVSEFLSEIAPPATALVCSELLLLQCFFPAGF